MHAGGQSSFISKCWQIYGATANKSGHVIAWKVITTVEAAGLRGTGRWYETINLVCLALFVYDDGYSKLSHVRVYMRWLNWVAHDSIVSDTLLCVLWANQAAAQCCSVDTAQACPHSALHSTIYYLFISLSLNSTRCSQCELCMSLCTSSQWWNALWPCWMWVSVCETLSHNDPILRLLYYRWHWKCQGWENRQR